MFVRGVLKRVYIAAGALIVVLIFLHFMGWLQGLERLTRALWNPVISFYHSSSVKLSNVVILPSTKNSLRESLNSCRNETINQGVNLARVKLLEKENAELKSQLNFKGRGPYPQIITEVIGVNVDNSGNNIVLSAGGGQGIKTGNPAISGEGVLVGVVSDVEPDIATVRLINDNRSKIAATLLNRSASLGVVEGGYGISIRMNFIPRNENVMIGDQVVTSGLQEKIPRGLLIGEVAATVNEAYQPFQQAVLTPSADLEKLTMVSVLLTD